MRHVSPLLFLLLFTAAGCAQRQAQVAVQTGLNVLAIGVDSTAEVAAAQLEDPAETARVQVLAERRICLDEGETCPESADIEHWLTRYDTYLSGWLDLARGLRASREALYGAQAMLSAWITSGRLPEATGPFCAHLENAIGALPGFLTEVGIETPGSLTAAVPHLSVVCEVVVQLIPSTSEGE